MTILATGLLAGNTEKWHGINRNEHIGLIMK